MDNYTGKRLDGRYEIQEVIGVGGMAVVYRAYDNIDDKIVAVKILKDEFLANEEFRRRFKNESKAISLLSHPNIVKVYNVNYGDRLQYIVMEYVEGITLKEYIEQQGHLGIKETVHFTMQILRALQHAHDKGIIHRDIKPQNIMLLSNGTIKVTDFGIARFSYSDTKTMTDSAIGSVHYISPEQARGLSIDERTDIYSIGVVMYEMLTGRLPFVSENSVSVALMQLQNDPRSIREINPNIPIGLEQIVMRAMEKNTKSRYQTASEMLLDIEEFKRNPNIHFNQSVNYFVDSEPTRVSNGGGAFVQAPAYVPPVAPPAPPVSVRNQAPVKVSKQDDYDDNYDYEGANKGKAGFVIMGVLIGLIVVLLGAFCVGYFFFPEYLAKVPVVGGLVASSGEKAPDFVGKTYDEIISDSKYKDFKISREFTEVTDANKVGIIVKQDPEPGKRVNSESKITVYVGQMQETVPDVIGMMWSAAEQQLKNAGFKVERLEYPNVEVEFGTVIKMSPEPGSKVDKGATITIYYASDTGYVKVPKVVGMNQSSAEAMLESMGLYMKVTEEDSDRPKGEIIDQDREVDSNVPKGTTINVTVSTGVAASNTLKLTLRLPNTNKEERVRIYVDNESKVSESIFMDGSLHTFSVEGKGEDASLKVRIDDSEYYSATVDFTKEDPVVTNARYADTDSSVAPATVINVIGMNAVAAETKLKNAGFTNISIVYVDVDDSSKNGMVISQNPSFGIVSTDTKIILTVGQSEGT